MQLGLGVGLHIYVMKVYGQDYIITVVKRLGGGGGLIARNKCYATPEWPQTHASEANRNYESEYAIK